MLRYPEGSSSKWGSNSKSISIGSDGKVVVEQNSGLPPISSDDLVNDGLDHDIGIRYTSADQEVTLFIDGKQQSAKYTFDRDDDNYVYEFGTNNDYGNFAGIITRLRWSK